MTMIYPRYRPPVRCIDRTVEELIAEQLMRIGDELEQLFAEHSAFHRGDQMPDMSPNRSLRKLRQFVAQKKVTNTFLVGFGIVCSALMIKRLLLQRA
ncbi:unnamed protein product [Echinostoma caproni]|uniref:Miff domain-containing protein n=1 Tax=Echinostoma caproni TaxID=27848 RepID=A0A183AW79_9TREM|nr:unnamed protein product [Echinostoma caproni]